MTTRTPTLSLLLPLTLALVTACTDADRGRSGDTGTSTDGWTDSDGGYSDGGYPDTGSGWGGDSEDWSEEDETGEEESGDTGVIEEECDEETPVTLWISPDDSNSMSSPVQIRAAVLDGWGSLSRAPVRTFELFNYYDFAYPAAPEGELAVHSALAPSDDMPNTWRLQIGVSSPALAKAERPPMNLALSFDTSGSMSGRPIQLSREVGEAIARNLRAGDRVSVVTWDTDNRVLLDRHVVDGPEDSRLMSVLRGLDAGGGTDLHGGLSKAYELAQEHFDPSRTNRVVLLSDGGANAGVTDIELISNHAGAEGADGIYLVGVGTSDEGSYNDALMDEVTDAGRGASVFVHTSEEVDRVFDEDFVNTMEVAARDVHIRVDLPPGFEIVRFSGEEYSGDPREVEPQNIAPNDAMVIHQVIRTCDEEVDMDSPVIITASWKDAITWEGAEASVETTLGELLAEDRALLHKGTALMAYSDALRVHQGAGTTTPAVARVEAREAIDIALAANPGDADLAELRAIVDALD